MTYRKFDLRENFEHCTDEQMTNLHFVFEKVEPYWRDCKMLSEEQRYRLAQCHTMAVVQTLRNIIIDRERHQIMERLRQEEADRLYNGDVSKLYLYYPHHLVDDEYKVKALWWIEYCDEDIENIEAALVKSRYSEGRFMTRDRYHLETMMNVFDVVREKLERRYLM
ncbi:hypothetical protein AVU32_gp026 [Vibrio phage ValKK3]|uniref:Uncharacterized protein n=1 Tax=Vibrio phage ValKK3 TaxID=1610855 RepID=A0A0D4DB11_9CAUD|nr:hypothetical protein AVU32_gp026 [Vibrio phage ValKK3]AJT60867.1 hypothetical protein [Vibrio phage ValKK3]